MRARILAVAYKWVYVSQYTYKNKLTRVKSKGHLFKLELTDDPTCLRCLEEIESATHILCDCEAIAYLSSVIWNQVTIMTPP
jgi:hypothetical protein